MRRALSMNCNILLGKRQHRNTRQIDLLVAGEIAAEGRAGLRSRRHRSAAPDRGGALGGLSCHSLSIGACRLVFLRAFAVFTIALIPSAIRPSQTSVEFGPDRCLVRSVGRGKAILDRLRALKRLARQITGTTATTCCISSMMPVAMQHDIASAAMIFAARSPIVPASAFIELSSDSKQTIEADMLANDAVDHLARRRCRIVGIDAVKTTWQVMAISSSFMAMKGGKSCASSSSRETSTTGSS
jgi:hypothetical protein